MLTTTQPMQRIVPLALAFLLVAACTPAPPQHPTATPQLGQALSTPVSVPLGETEKSGPAPPTPSPATRETPSPAATPSPVPSARFKGGREPVVQKGPSAPPVAQLVDVRIGRNEGFDRIVFEFKGNLPGYRISYVAPPILEDGSGHVLSVQGQAFLEARFEPASGYDFERNAPSYTGPREIHAGLPTLLEVKRSGDFEAVLTWVLGLEREIDFRVAELSDPLRVVIDAAH